jgi:Flp pilus assembly pilin Flp
MMSMRKHPRFPADRRGAQLIEEALLLSVALVALSLLVGGIESILKQSTTYTSNIWNAIASSLANLFGSVFHW